MNIFCSYQIVKKNISSVNLDTFIISLILFNAFILMLVLSVLQFYLSNRNKNLKTHVDLLIQPNLMIEMKISINQ